MSYIEAKEKYSRYGIDTEKALEALKGVSISVHCWQGDDVVGFDSKEALSGGIQATGNYPGRARTPEELMADYDKTFSLIGGKKKLNLHACYAIFEDGEAVGRDALEPKHFAKWVEFAKERGMGMKMMPVGEVWEEFLSREGVVADYFAEVKKYESEVLSRR